MHGRDAELANGMENMMVMVGLHREHPDPAYLRMRGQTAQEIRARGLVEGPRLRCCQVQAGPQRGARQRDDQGRLEEGSQ